MKRRIFFLLYILSILFSGCSRTEEKINIIKGAGNANNSLMISFAEVCPGTVEGFGASTPDLILSRWNNGKLELHQLNTSSKEDTLILSAMADQNYYAQISANGKSVLLNNHLIDLVSKEVTYLPPISASLSRPADYNEFSGYSFISEGELVLTDPYYYLSKFRKSIYKSSLSFLTPSPSVTRLGDTGIRMDPGSFSGIKAPDVSNILSYKLHLQELKFIFIGQKLKTGEKVLMVFDFNEKKFSQIDVGVSRFDLAPDGNSICYTKALGGSDHLQAIYTAGVSGENKKELAQHAEIRSFTWSTDSQWVAYSGGSPSNCDIFVAKSDGSKQEQLTHNIFAADKLAWKGNKLAFTSDGGKSPELPSIYLITLNVQNVENPPPTAAYPKNPQLAYQLISFLRAETSIHLNKKSGT